MMTPRGRSVVFALSAFLLACGGAQDAAPAPEPAPVAVEAPAPEPEPERAALAEADASVLYHVFWDGIHVMTVYPYAGLLRSEESSSAAPYNERNPHFSVMSHYYEREGMWVPAMNGATSLEDFLDRLRAVELVEIVEFENEPQSF